MGGGDRIQQQMYSCQNMDTFTLIRMSNMLKQKTSENVIQLLISLHESCSLNDSIFSIQNSEMYGLILNSVWL